MKNTTLKKKNQIEKSKTYIKLKSNKVHTSLTIRETHFTLIRKLQ